MLSQETLNEGPRGPSLSFCVSYRMVLARATRSGAKQTSAYFRNRPRTDIDEVSKKHNEAQTRLKPVSKFSRQAFRC